MNQLWPSSAALDAVGELFVGGCSTSTLAREFGTPLYVFDEATLRDSARTYKRLLSAYGATAVPAYASKAFLCTAVAQLMDQEGLDLDVVAGGELHVALHAGFPAERIHFHGNNKSKAELREALRAGVGRIVADNFHELELLCELAGERGEPASIWLRLAPGVQAHTHAHIQTGQEDTKFGFSIAHGDAERAVVRALHTPELRLLGLHAHIGSQIYEPESLADAADRLLAFAAAMRERHGFVLAELSPGGGWGVPMTGDDPPAPFEPYISALIAAVHEGCERRGIPLPHLVLEPGRSVVARAGVALYTVGSRKEIPGVRTYVAVDGGMADNIRPALYGARYAALKVPAPPKNAALETVTIAGKYCESGDILIRDIDLPRLAPGDLLAIPMAGAYTLAMASNYNQNLRPAVVFVREGEARLVQRRERYADLVVRDGSLSSTGKWPAPRPLYKYDALGNDYIVLDPLDWPQLPDEALIRRVCNRHRGVGSDGILYGPLSREPFEVRLFNPDGSEFEKSGNGLRIFARYLWERGLPRGSDFAIETPGGRVIAHILNDDASEIALEMGYASFMTEDAGATGPNREMLEEAVRAAGCSVPITVVSLGNPHCVVFPDDETIEMTGGLVQMAHVLGPSLETHSLYANRTNVQFARVADKHTVDITIWERGAGYTLASGSSSCAVAAAAIRTGRCESPVTVRMPGGEVLVEVAVDWSLRLTGTVEPVCRAEWLA